MPIPAPERQGAYTRFLLDFRSNDLIRDFVDGAELERYGRAGVARATARLMTIVAVHCYSYG